jgi:GTP-binding protein EngB required for normal cell division
LDLERDGRLNEFQRRRLLVSCQYIDKLLSNVEEILIASASRSPFPRWIDDTSPVQRKVAQDYVARLRAQLVRVLDGQDIVHPAPTTGSIHAIRVILSFVEIAAEELKPKYMRGYGEVADSMMPELNGIANEIQQIARKLYSYLAQGLGQDLQGRLERLERTGDEVALLKTIERVIMDHGLVEFRSPLSIILDRLEENRFEIAFFGRVSAGKSSLLNHVLDSEILPVGVNPITAIPTRIGYGPIPRLIVHFADKQAETLDIGRLVQFATEQQNPANTKHVTRISAEVPSPRLQNGVTFVDTPGLGSLASSGAAETLAYLPRCDLGIVLIDAGSTLTQEDLSTIRTLYEASTPAQVLLSKADLLKPTERTQALRYIESHINSELGLNLSVHAVSIIGNDARLLDRWFEEEIASLYDRHQQLAQSSLKRKISSLAEAVESALEVRLTRAERDGQVDKSALKDVEGELRRAGGKIEETHALYRRLLGEPAEIANKALHLAAKEVVEQWESANGDKGQLSAVVNSTINQVVAAKGKELYELLHSLRSHLSEVLDRTERALNLNHTSEEGRLDHVLKEMPRLDLGTVDLDLRFSLLTTLGERVARSRVEKALQKQMGPALIDALVSYGKLLEAWTARVFDDLQRRFGERADWYRAQIERETSSSQVSPDEEKALRLDLKQLRQSHRSTVCPCEVIDA